MSPSRCDGLSVNGVQQCDCSHQHYLFARLGSASRLLRFLSVSSMLVARELQHLIFHTALCLSVFIIDTHYVNWLSVCLKQACSNVLLRLDSIALYILYKYTTIKVIFSHCTLVLSSLICSHPFCKMLFPDTQQFFSCFRQYSFFTSLLNFFSFF